MQSLTKNTVLERNLQTQGVKAEAGIAKIAALVSIAGVLQISESLIPQPVPGVRVGLANMITLITLVELGFKSALEVAVLRTIVSSFILGTFMTPTFVMSFSGALVSTAVMGAFAFISSQAPKYGFSIIGISILGAIAHNVTQLSVAYFLLIKHPSIFYFLPILMISAVIMGWITGFVTIQVILKLRKSPLADPGLEEIDSSPLPSVAAQAMAGENSGNSFVHRMAPQWKIVMMMALCVLIVFLRDFRAYGVLAIAIIGLMLITRLPWKAYGNALVRVRSLGSFILISFSFPILFSAAGSTEVIAGFGPLKISQQGLATGSLFAVRLIMLLWVSYLFSVFTSPSGITCGLSKILSPFRFLGLPVNRMANVISISWSGLPSFREKVRATIRQREDKLRASGQKRTGIERAKNLIHIISDIIISVYRQSESSSAAAAQSIDSTLETNTPVMAGSGFELPLVTSKKEQGGEKSTRLETGILMQAER